MQYLNEKTAFSHLSFAQVPTKFIHDSGKAGACDVHFAYGPAKSPRRPAQPTVDSRDEADAHAKFRSQKSKRYAYRRAESLTSMALRPIGGAFRMGQQWKTVSFPSRLVLEHQLHHNFLRPGIL